MSFRIEEGPELLNSWWSMLKVLSGKPYRYQLKVGLKWAVQMLSGITANPRRSIFHALIRRSTAVPTEAPEMFGRTILMNRCVSGGIRKDVKMINGFKNISAV